MTNHERVNYLIGEVPEQTADLACRETKLFRLVQFNVSRGLEQPVKPTIERIQDALWDQLDDRKTTQW